MTKEIRVHIKGTQRMDGGDPDSPIELKTTGIHRVVGGRHHIRYDEAIEGTVGNTRNHIAVGGGRVEVHKTGQVQTDMIFEPGKTNASGYTTQFGTIRMDVHTSDLSIRDYADGLDVKIRYDLLAGGQHIADCVMEMSFQSDPQM